VTKGLDVKKLQLLLGHASIVNFEQLKSEYEKLWESNDTE
jgi:site-specific recombinase XerD